MGLLRHLKAALGTRARRLVWDLSEHGGANGCGNYYDSVLERVVDDVVVSVPEGTIFQGFRGIRHDLMARHSPKSLRTPLWPVTRLHLATGLGVAYLPSAALGIHPYCGYEYNHYHLLVDVLPRVLAYTRVPALDGIPILVNQHILRCGAISELVRRVPSLVGRLVAPDARYLRIDRLHVINRPGLTREKFEDLQGTFGSERHTGSRRVFLVRNVSRRSLRNQSDVADRLAELGFETIDFATLSFTDQLRVACETQHLVAIHGAGIANMIFRSVRPTTLLELRPSYMPANTCTFFGAMAAELGWVYDSLTGPGDIINDSFTIDPDEVQRAARSLLGAVCGAGEPRERARGDDPGAGGAGVRAVRVPGRGPLGHE